jgi:N-acetylglucosaminyl-diphospho-decaprenol L-rhamnosyltransferase
MRLTVVVVTCNERDDVVRCAESLYAHPPGGGQQVVVVDNGSTDGTVEALSERAPEAEIVTNQRNRGLTVARNQGLRRADGEYVAMLDSDTSVRAGTLETLCRYLDEHLEIGLVGPKLVFPDGSLQYSCRRFPTPMALVANRLTSVPGLAELPARRRYLMLDENHDREMAVDYVLGAAMVFRREAVAAIGEFDEHFGFSTPGGYGFDDADWALRFHRAGWGVAYVPAAVAEHRYRRRLAKRPFARQNLALAASYVRLRLKHRGAAWRPASTRPAA